MISLIPFDSCMMLLNRYRSAADNYIGLFIQELDIILSCII